MAFPFYFIVFFLQILKAVSVWSSKSLFHFVAWFICIYLYSGKISKQNAVIHTVLQVNFMALVKSGNILAW